MIAVVLAIALPLLLAIAVVYSPRPPEPGTPSCALVGLGGSFGFLTYGAAFLFTMAVVPRVSEGVRNVVNLPWPVYVAIPTTMAFVALAAFSVLIPRRKRSSFFIVGFNLAVAASTCVGSALLRRDYIGKF